MSDNGNNQNKEKLLQEILKKSNLRDYRKRK